MFEIPCVLMRFVLDDWIVVYLDAVGMEVTFLRGDWK